MPHHDSTFEMATSNLRFGPGVAREVGMDLADMQVRRVMLVTDPTMKELPPVRVVRESLENEKVEYDPFASRASF